MEEGAETHRERRGHADSWPGPLPQERLVFRTGVFPRQPETPIGVSQYLVSPESGIDIGGYPLPVVVWEYSAYRASLFSRSRRSTIGSLRGRLRSRALPCRGPVSWRKPPDLRVSGREWWRAVAKTGPSAERSH